MELDIAALDEAAAEDSFSGTVAVHVDGEAVFSRCYGMAHRAHGIPNSIDTRFGLASGSKMFTALAILRLVEDGALTLDRPVREILGADLPLIDDAVTVEHLLAHTSGIGDYLDEEGDWEPDDFFLTVPVHTLTTAEAFLPMMDGFPQAFPPGERFAYCNGGYMVLGIVLERLTGEAYPDLVDRLVLRPAGLAHTGFPRLDELPGDVAAGYLFDTGDRMNTLYLPVRGNGDGGAILSAGEIHRIWNAFFDDAIVSAATRELMIAPRTFVEEEDLRFGLGMWLHKSNSATILEGYDSGVSVQSAHLPETRTTVSVLGNTSEGAWPVIGVIAAAVSAIEG